MLRRAITVALAAAALGLSAFGGTTSDPATDFHAGFVDGCTRKGTPESLCQCFYDKLVARYPAEEAVRRIQSGQLGQQEMAALSQPCLAGAGAGS